MDTIEFSQLIGKHIFSGIDRESRIPEVLLANDYDREKFQDAACINFTLDGITYTAIEDPDDGYRSSLEAVFITGKADTINEFQPIEVLVVDPDIDGYDIIQIYDTENGMLILEIGTCKTDYYYPYFIGNFYPENMSINNP